MGKCSACLSWTCLREDITRLRSIRHFDGLPLDARTVTDKLVLQEEI